ncbi:MAG: hypothetical protein ABR601_06600 [Parasphingopyxis sp.]
MAGSACATVAEPRGDGWAAIGEATRAGTLTVTPLEIVEDSRCPEGVHCVWAGRLVVRTRIEGDPSRLVELTLGEEIRAADGLLELDRIEPEAAEGIEIPPGRYRFHYRHAPFIMDRD